MDPWNGASQVVTAGHAPRPPPRRSGLLGAADPLPTPLPGSGALQSLSFLPHCGWGRTVGAVSEPDLGAVPDALWPCGVGGRCLDYWITTDTRHADL
jgi:hypothetical protein